MTKNSLYSFLRKKKIKHLLFWCVVFIYYLSISWSYERNKSFFIQATFFDFILQIILAKVIIGFFIPNLLNKNKKLLFFCSCFLSIYIAYITYSAFKCFYLAEVFKGDSSIRPPLSFINKITNIYPFLRSLPSYMLPTVVLIIFNYYKQQKEVISLLEQKKTNELNALKNQLNPHFLFNTLNNLYTLALKKSDRTPEVIAKLSEILDYILYRCKDDFVPLKNEISLLHNYIALEKVRYGKRVEITFNETVESNAKIAPLLLLTFLENSFKHGVSQEINTAKIDIAIKGKSNEINFYIKNTKPSNSTKISPKDRESIGLQNIKKQLDLLYQNQYTLDIINSTNTYIVTLKIILNEL